MIVGWHGVSLVDEHERFPSLFISRESFRRRLEFLRKNFRVIDLDEAVRQHTSGRFEPRQVVLTFDDGFYNFLAAAVPILRELRMTATNYLVSQQMYNQLPAFPLIIRDIILSSDRHEPQLSLPALNGPGLLGRLHDRDHLIRCAFDGLRGLPEDNAVRLEYIQTLATDLGGDFDDLVNRRVWTSLDASEVKSLSDEGFAMQLHTHSHRGFVNKSRDTMEQEVTTCRKTIEAVTGKAAPHFCYPRGLWCREAWDALRKAGVQSATTTRHGPNFAKTPILSLRRVLNGEDRSQLEFEFEMSNLRWILYAVFHPKQIYAPSEKHVGYAHERRAF